MIFLTLGLVAVVAGIEAGTRRLDARRLALLATICALNSALRATLVIGLEGFSPMFFLILCAGYVFGPSYGFLAGACSLLVSGIVTGGLGPWLPYEMVSAGLVGIVAGLVGLLGARSNLASLLVLAATGALMGFVYGALTDVYDWTAFYRGVPDIGWVAGLNPSEVLVRFGRFYLVTSLVYDAFRAGGNAATIVVLGAPVIAAMARFKARFTFTVERLAPSEATP